MSRAAIFVVATPIGNLEDLSERAFRTLKEADIIAAEDTRRARQLLNHLGIQKKEVISYYDQVEERKAPQICERLISEDKTLALISDAGTPCISDPGFRLVREARSRQLPVHPIPGASAVTALLSVSGLPTDRFMFLGFLPTKRKLIREELESWRYSCKTVVFFESTRRLSKTLTYLEEVYPEAEVCIGRELTKIHEDIFTGSIQEVRLIVEEKMVFKGEAVVVVSLPKQEMTGESSLNLGGDQLIESLRSELKQGKTFKDLIRKYQDCGLARSELYQLLVKLKEELD